MNTKSTKRDDILIASLTVFKEEGLKGARMERIAEEAHVSKRTLYKYFESKDALFQAIAGSVIETLSSMEIPAFETAVPLRPQLKKAVQHYFAQVTESHFLDCSRVLMAELMRNPDFAKTFNATFHEIDAPLSRFIADAMDHGLVKSGEPAAATVRLLSLFKATIYLPSLVHDTSAMTADHFEQIATECVETFLDRYAIADKTVSAGS